MTSHPFENQPQGGQAPSPLRPKDAASILVLDRSGTTIRVLVGKRGNKHAFMPNFYVFPGGRRDRTDHALPYSSDLHASVLTRLTGGKTDEAAVRRGRALALAAIRELHEETGLVLGQLEVRGTVERLVADLSSLRYVARAVTPPGNVRRFDTRFFCTFTDETALRLDCMRNSEELHDLQWLDIGSNSTLNIPPITQTILEDVQAQMTAQPSLPFDLEGPYYYARRGQFLRSGI